MTTQHRLEPGDRLVLEAGSIARVTDGSVNAHAIPHDGDLIRGAGVHLAALGVNQIAIALPGAVRVELFAPAASTVTIEPVPAAISPGLCQAIDVWIRAVEAIGAWTPFTAPRALFPGAVEIRHGDVVAAPREQVVWTPTAGQWRPLTDGAPGVWHGPAAADITTTQNLAGSGALPAAIEAWGLFTADRLAGLLEAMDRSRAAMLSSGVDAADDALRAMRSTIAATSGSDTLTRGEPPVLRAITLAMPDSATGVTTRAGGTINEGRETTAPIIGHDGTAPDTEPRDGMVRPADAATGADQTATMTAVLLAAARAEAVDRGLGAREVAIPAHLTRQEGPPLIVTLTGADGVPHPAAASASGSRYEVRRADGGRGVPAGAQLDRRGLALTGPLSATRIAALDAPHRLFAVLAGLSMMDMVAALILGMAGVALGVAVPVATNLLFTSIWPRADLEGHWLVVVGLGIAALATIGFDSARSARAGRVSTRFLIQFENAIWLGLVRARPGALAGQSAGDLQNRLGAIGRLRQAMLGQPMRFIIDCAAMLTSAVMMAVYGGVLAWIGAGAIALLATTWALLLRQAVRARTETEEIAGRETALLTQAVAAIAKIKATASEPFLLARWAVLASRHRAAIRQAERIDTAIAIATAGVTGLSTALVFGIGGIVLYGTELGVGSVLATQGGITLGAFLAFQTSLGQTISAASSAAGIFALWPQVSAAGARLGPLARVPPEAEPGVRRSQAPPLDGRLAISQVTHHYPGADAASLTNVEIDIAPREYVAIVGASGSGKSTLLRLILGLEQPTSGAVYFDGLDAQRLDPASIRRQIGYVGQDARMAPGSVLDNILDGRPFGAPEAWTAARLAGVAEDIEAMPMGMHTLVGEAGQNLSGGQRQRLMIARALLTRPRILIFDEATSALDNRAQALVQSGLADLPVTRIVVAHRLSTVMEVDRVFVLERGRVAESGAPEALLRQGGAFAALARRQRLDISMTRGV